MKKMIGTTERLFSFHDLFWRQVIFQRLVTGQTPCDNPEQMKYHIAAMIEELGEVLKADKRWKTHRNTTFVPEEKIDELADVFITAMNLAIWSGLSSNDILAAIEGKLDENFKRLEGANNASHC